MDYYIRKSEIEDSYELSRFIAITWNETYKGLVPDNYLESLYENIKERSNDMKAKYQKEKYNEYLLFINNELSGFVRFGKSLSVNDNEIGEIYALYVLSKYQKLGFGKKLVDLAIKELKKIGYKKMVIACLKGNPSNDFYKHIGGIYLKDGLYKRLNLLENVYIYNL